MWSSDRILRLCRILWYSYSNTATITPLPNGGTRIILRRSPSRAVPGTHCFLWIPRIRPTETHPFTIVSATAYSLELVVASYDGFTKDLHKYAKERPGAALRASIDGPYGAIPNFSKDVDKVVLIAGGSGASFTFGIALDMIKKLGDCSKSTIDFIWAVKEQEFLSWFSKKLSELQSSPLVTVSLYVTSQPSPYCTVIPSPYCTVLTTLPSPSSPISPSYDPEKHLPVSNLTIAHTSTTPSSQLDIEKHLSFPVADPWDSSSSLNIVSATPDIENIIRRVVRDTNGTDWIAIAACGPDGLMKSVRRTAADCITVKGPSVELHCEQFGW